jgi:hypothetical protein
MEDWFQLLNNELQKQDDEHLWNWPTEWWKQLLFEGMNPMQAVRYTTRVMHRTRKPTVDDVKDFPK